MIHIDGSEQLGSGTIVRFAVAFSALLRRPLHMINARAKRPKPGLRPQHLAAVRACAQLSGAATAGLAVGSQEFEFLPGPRIRGGTYEWNIGTAGSTTMLALGILPLACLADGPVRARITGGVFQDFAPSPHHMQHLLLPLLARMGAKVSLQITRAGYVPTGRGVIDIEVKPVARLSPLQLAQQGQIGQVEGVAFCSHLRERQVSERMAAACEQRLAAAGLRTQIQRISDTQAAHAGASLAIWTETSTGCRLGADRAGAPRRTSEAIGQFVADQFLNDLRSGATTDCHLADQLVLFTALADGISTYIAPAATEHLETNLWLARRFGAAARCDDRHVVVDGLAIRHS